MLVTSIDSKNKACKLDMIMGVSTGELQIGDNWQTKSKQSVWPWFDGNRWINLDSDALLKQNCHTQNMKYTIIYGAKCNLSSSFSNHTVGKPIQHYQTRFSHSCYTSLKVTVTFFILPFRFPGIKLATTQFIIFLNFGWVHGTETS
jgi:hypothetical protein